MLYSLPYLYNHGIEISFAFILSADASWHCLSYELFFHQFSCLMDCYIFTFFIFIFMKSKLFFVYYTSFLYGSKESPFPRLCLISYLRDLSLGSAFFSLFSAKVLWFLW